jgi:hypothetical protein
LREATMNVSTKAVLLATACAVTAAGVVPFALAQSLPADPAAIFSLQGENAAISTSKVTDRYYTNGIRVGWTSPTGYAPALEGIGRTVFGEGQQRISVNISQQIYTPYDNFTGRPPANDRPYAGVLLASFAQSVETLTSRSQVGFSIGVVGPSALGEEVQNGFHELIGQKKNKGWNTQLKDEVAFGFSSSRVWRLSTGTVGGLETEALPAAAASLGTLRIALDAGVNVRIGQRLQSDFGTPLIRALSGGDAFRRPDSFGWYVFAGLGGSAVARDVTLDGSTWRDNSRSVKPYPFVGRAQAGAAVTAFGARLTYTHVIETAEFKRQKGGAHQFGSLALSVRF